MGHGDGKLGERVGRQRRLNLAQPAPSRARRRDSVFGRRDMRGVAKMAARFGSGATRHACHGLWRSLLVAIAGAFMATIIAGCADPRSGAVGTQPTAAGSVTTPDLALCGSNTIGSQLGPDLAHGFLRSLGAQDIRSTVSGDEQTLTARLNGGTANVHIAAHGTAT